MKHSLKTAIVRVLTDLIKADAIIDAGEMEKYSILKTKYCLTSDDELDGSQMTLAESMNIISRIDKQFKQTFLSDCMDLTVSDGFCAPSEALLMIALISILEEDGDNGKEVLSILNSTFNIASSSILYIESQFDVEINNVISKNYRALHKETQIAGFNFIYVPAIIKHYQETDRSLMVRIISFLAPSLSENEIDHVIKSLYSTTTSSFCKDILCNKLDVSLLRNAAPSILIKIGSSYVKKDTFANYLKVDVDKNILFTIQNIIDKFLSMISSDIISVSTAEEKSHQFLYHGFYKQLLDIFLTKQNVRSRLYINTFTEDIIFPDIHRKLEKLHRREKALYILLLIMTKEGGINFNSPQSAKQLSAYNRMLAELQMKYQTIYGYLGGDKAPDLGQAEIRRPIISCIRRSLSELDGLLYNVADYKINKNEFGNLNIGLEEDLLFVYDSKSNSMIHLFDSELYKRVIKS